MTASTSGEFIAWANCSPTAIVSHAPNSFANTPGDFIVKPVLGTTATRALAPFGGALRLAIGVTASPRLARSCSALSCAYAVGVMAQGLSNMFAFSLDGPRTRADGRGHGRCRPANRVGESEDTRHNGVRDGVGGSYEARGNGQERKAGRREHGRLEDRVVLAARRVFALHSHLERRRSARKGRDVDAERESAGAARLVRAVHCAEAGRGQSCES